MYRNTFFYLDTNWRRVVIFTPRSLYHLEKSRRYQSDRRLDGLPAGQGDKEKRKILDPTGTRTRTLSVVNPIASRYTESAIADLIVVVLSWCHIHSCAAKVLNIKWFILRKWCNGVFAAFRYSFMETLRKWKDDSERDSSDQYNMYCLCQDSAPELLVKHWCFKLFYCNL
jgi:hypothetical protein